MCTEVVCAPAPAWCPATHQVCNPASARWCSRPLPGWGGGGGGEIPSVAVRMHAALVQGAAPLELVLLLLLLLLALALVLVLFGLVGFVPLLLDLLVRLAAALAAVMLLCLNLHPNTVTRTFYCKVDLAIL